MICNISKGPKSKESNFFGFDLTTALIFNLQIQMLKIWDHYQFPFFDGGNLELDLDKDTGSRRVLRCPSMALHL